MKKLIALILVLITITSLSACETTDEPTSDSGFVISTGGVSANTYLLDSWKEEAADGARDYYLSFYLHSSDYYAILTSDSVQFLSDSGEYKPLVDVFEQSVVDIIEFNDYKQGTSAIALIKTKQMIDSKKVYVLMEGPLEYDKDINTRDDYIQKYNKEPSDEEWIARLCSSSNQTPPIKTTTFVHNDEKGLFGLSSDGKHYFTYAKLNKTVISGDRVYSQFEIRKITNFTTEQIVNSLNSSLYGAKLVDGQFEYCENDANIQIYCELEDNILTVGYKTTDGTSIGKFLSQLPHYLAYDGILSASVGLLVIED